MNYNRRERIIKKKIIMWFFAVMVVLMFFRSGTVLANDSVVIIVNAANNVDSLTLHQVQEFYHNEKFMWPDGKKVTLYDLTVKDGARRKFSNIVLGQEPEKVAMEWANKKITNTAKNPPRMVRSTILMQNRVAKDPGAIGYLRKSDLTRTGVKVIAIIE
jgi:ABC-type phosphate transport system substrate-binding protein